MVSDPLTDPLGDHDHSQDGEGGDTLDPDVLAGADIANAAADEVPKATGGGQLSFGPLSAGTWAEDGNSPQTTTGSTTFSYTVATPSDYLLVFAKVTDVAGVGDNVNVTTEGDTTTNYNYVTQSGTNTTGASSIGDMIRTGANSTSHAVFAFNGTVNDVSVMKLSQRGYGADTVAGRNLNNQHPVGSFELRRPSNADWEVSVFRRDV